MALNDSERLGLTAWKYSLRPLEDELVVSRVCLGATRVGLHYSNQE